MLLFFYRNFIFPTQKLADNIINIRINSVYLWQYWMTSFSICVLSLTSSVRFSWSTVWYQNSQSLCIGNWLSLHPTKYATLLNFQIMQHTHTRILTCDKKHITQVYIYRVYTISLHYDLTKVKKTQFLQQRAPSIRWRLDILTY